MKNGGVLEACHPFCKLDSFFFFLFSDEFFEQQEESAKQMAMFCNLLRISAPEFLQSKGASKVDEL